MHGVGLKNFVDQDVTVAHQPEWKSLFTPETAAKVLGQWYNGNIVASDGNLDGLVLKWGTWHNHRCRIKELRQDTEANMRATACSVARG